MDEARSESKDCAAQTPPTAKENEDPTLIASSHCILKLCLFSKSSTYYASGLRSITRPYTAFYFLDFSITDDGGFMGLILRIQKIDLSKETIQVTYIIYNLLYL